MFRSRFSKGKIKEFMLPCLNRLFKTINSTSKNRLTNTVSSTLSSCATEGLFLMQNTYLINDMTTMIKKGVDIFSIASDSKF